MPGRENAPECTCPTGYYDSGVEDCTLCQDVCTECTGYNQCTACKNSDMRSGPQCECPEGYYDAADGEGCIESLVDDTEDLIEVTVYDEAPRVEINIDPSTLADDYEIGFGFYYKFMFRLPVRIEEDFPRGSWLGIAGLSENGDYGADSAAGDRVISMF
jgi:hypothetical protein